MEFLRLEGLFLPQTYSTAIANRSEERSLAIENATWVTFPMIL